MCSPTKWGALIPLKGSQGKCNRLVNINFVKFNKLSYIEKKHGHHKNNNSQYDSINIWNENLIYEIYDLNYRDK